MPMISRKTHEELPRHRQKECEDDCLKKASLSHLRDALQAGFDSGIAEDGVFNRVRQRAGLPPMK